MDNGTDSEKNALIGAIINLTIETTKGYVDWIPDWKLKLNSMDPNRITHPLFQKVLPENSDEILFFVSAVFGSRTTIFDTCFHVKIDDENTIYLMYVADSKGLCGEALELWMFDDTLDQPVHICNSRENSGVYEEPLFALYKETTAHVGKPELKLPKES